MEASLHGVATQAQVDRLSELLQGLCVGSVLDVAQQHVCLLAPAVDEDSVPTEIHLLRSVNDGVYGSWCVCLSAAGFTAALDTTETAPRLVRHYGRTLTGEKADKLGAAVREVCEAKALAGDALRAFLGAKGMGCKMHYQVLRRGFRCVRRCARVAGAHARCRFRLLLAGLPVDVSILVLETRGGDGQPASLVPGLWLVEVTCRTTQEAYVKAVDAVVLAQQRLGTTIELTKPGSVKETTRTTLTARR